VVAGVHEDRGSRDAGRKGGEQEKRRVTHLARLDVDAQTARALVEGRSGAAPAGAPGKYRCYGPLGRFLGLVEASGETLRAIRLARTDIAPGPGPRETDGLALES